MHRVVLMTKVVCFFLSWQATDAFHFFSSGQSKIQQGLLREGYELISEALNLLNNVYGAMHSEIAACLRLLARLNYIMGDYPEVSLWSVPTLHDQLCWALFIHTRFSEIQTHERLKRVSPIRINHNVQSFEVILYIRVQNDT